MHYIKPISHACQPSACILQETSPANENSQISSISSLVLCKSACYLKKVFALKTCTGPELSY